MMNSVSEVPGVDNSAFDNKAFQNEAAEDKSKLSNTASQRGIPDKDGIESVGFSSAGGDDVFVSVSKQPHDKEVPDKPDDERRKQYMYGWGVFKPNFLQKLNKTRVFVICSVLLCFMEGLAVNGIANAALPNIEKQFGLPSSQSALISSFESIGALCVVLFVSFIGGRYNKALWVATGSVVMATGSLLFMVPHMATDAPVLGSKGGPGAGLCDLTNSSTNEEPAPAGSSGLSHYLGVFLVASILHGVGFTPMFTLGTVYIDENETHSTAAVYVGMTYAAAAVGVALGFFIGGEITENFYVDFDRVDQASLSFGPRDPQWIGAWWLGFIISVTWFILIAVPLYGFPRAIPGSEKYQQELHQDPKEMEEKKSIPKLLIDTAVEFFKAVAQFVVNVEYMFLCLGGAAETLIIIGVGAFSFKYLAEQYDLPFDVVGYVLGGLILFSSFGMVLGGILIRVFRLDGAGMARLNMIMCLLTSVLGLAALAKCPNVLLAGLEVPYPGESSVEGYRSSCQGPCDCSSQIYSPVCGADGIVYFSPCHAGCRLQTTSGPAATYSNCSCILNNSTLNTTGPDSTATKGRCDTGCTNVYILAPFLFVMLLAVLTTTTPVSMATLRCVKPELKSFALGFQWMLMRLFGAIPGPVLIGFVLDTSCSIWSPATPEGTPFCLLYDKEKMSVGVLIWWISVNLTAAVCFFIAFIASARKKKSLDLNKS